MHTMSKTVRRPASLLAIALTLLLAAMACGAASQPAPPTAPPAKAKAAQNHAESAPQAAETQAGSVDINLPIANRATSLTRDDLRVSQGDTVRLIFEADEEGEIHLHGYDLTAEVAPGHPGELVFEAATAGAFALNFHVFAADNAAAPDDHHGAGAPQLIASETPISVAITAEPDANGGVNVRIVTEGFRFAPDLVDQAHTSGAGHAHIYVDGVKLGRVFEEQYYIPELAPGDHEIRVSLNTNDHSELAFNGKKAESTVTVTIPDVGQGHGDSDVHQHDNGHSHSHGTSDQREIVAEIHLGNLEVYP